MITITLTALNTRTHETVTFDGLTAKGALAKWNHLAADGRFTVEGLKINGHTAPAEYAFLHGLANSTD